MLLLFYPPYVCLPAACVRACVLTAHVFMRQLCVSQSLTMDTQDLLNTHTHTMRGLICRAVTLCWFMKRYLGNVVDFFF